jgi:hypothetical protein
MRPTFRTHVHKPSEYPPSVNSPVRALGLMEAVERFIRNQLLRKRERTLRK